MTAIPCTWLFVPATRPDRVVKALSGPADVVIIDLEDSVAKADKQGARVQALALVGRVAAERVALRINSLASLDGLDDLAMLLHASDMPGWLVLPKSESPDVLRLVAALLDEAGSAIRLIALVESARGIQRVDEIAASGKRLAAVMFGAADAASDLRSPPGGPLLRHARERIAVACAGARIAAIDSPSFILDAVEGIVAETRQAADLGFVGKAAIHPAQIEPIRIAFRPDAGAIERARRIVELSSTGVAVLDGAMIDEAMAKGARALLARWS